MTRNPEDSIKTDVKQFVAFHELLTRDAPKLYKPYYLVIQKQNKEPVPGINWKKHIVPFERAVGYMSKGYNIGIAGTDADCLCILDVDDMEKVPAREIKSTLQVISRKRIGRHYFYFCYDGSAKCNIPAGVGELRSLWQYVLTPGSYVACSEEEIERMPLHERLSAGCYSIHYAAPPSSLVYDELPSVYRAKQIALEAIQKEAELKAVARKHRVVPKIKKYRSELWDLSITKVSGVSSNKFKKVPMPSEIHGSETGHNCSVSGNIMFCWRDTVTHSSFSYLAVLAGVGDCAQMGKPPGGSFGADYQDGETIFRCWMYAKSHGMISADDPIPHTALVYYALNRKICTRDTLVDGRLTDFYYMITLEIAEKEGINFGRK